jgi:hypothetical protein
VTHATQRSAAPWLERQTWRRLEQRLQAGLEAARSTGSPRLANVTASCPQARDPTALVVRSRRPHDPWFCLEQPDRGGSAIATLGCARAMEARGPDRRRLAVARPRRARRLSRWPARLGPRRRRRIRVCAGRRSLTAVGRLRAGVADRTGAVVRAAGRQHLDHGQRRDRTRRHDRRSGGQGGASGGGADAGGAAVARPCAGGRLRGDEPDAALSLRGGGRARSREDPRR